MSTSRAAFSLEPNKWSLAPFKEEAVSHLIFRYAAAPNTSSTTAMTVTVMAAMLPAEERPRRDSEVACLVISASTVPTHVSSERKKLFASDHGSQN